MTTPTAPTTPTTWSIGRIARAALNPSVLFSAIAPFVAYQLLHLAGVDDLLALSIAAAFPLAATLLAAVRTRRLDALGALSLTFIAIGVGSAALFQDPRLVLVAHALRAGLIGLIFLGSVAIRRPVLHALSRQFAARTAGGTLRSATAWPTSAAFRARIRLLTAIWGAALVVGSTAHVTAALLLPIPTAVSLEPVIMVLALGPAVVYTLRLRARGIPLN